MLSSNLLKLLFRLSNSNKSLIEQNYYAAEALIFTIYHHQKSIHDKATLDLLESKVDSPFAQKVIQLVKKTVTPLTENSATLLGSNQPRRKEREARPMILHDRLGLVLDGIAESGFIDQNVRGHFHEMFDPKKGFQDQYLQIIQKLRYEGGVNESQHFSIQLNSALLPIIMHQLYSISKQTGKLKSIPDIRINHIVGTPGMGKSFRFYALKHFHDFRIPYLLSLGKDSKARSGLFEKDYKIFYVDSQKQQEDLREYFLNQLKKDFNRDMEDSFEEQTSFYHFLKKIMRLYYEKKVMTRIIIDQVNQLYKFEDYQRLMSNKLIRSMVSSFSKPAICVSSKNNPYLSPKTDPILYAARQSLEKRYHIKTMLENNITPERRLSYVIQCLIFELEKSRHITRSKAIKIISYQKLKISFLTHLEIARAVKSTLKEYSMTSLSNLTNQQEYRKFAQKLQIQLDKQQQKSLFLTNFYEIIQNVQRDKKMQKDQQDFWTYSMAQILSFTMKQAKTEKVIGRVKLLNDQGEVKCIKKQFQCMTKVEENKPTSQKYDTMSQCNFFFQNTVQEKTTNYFFYSQQIANKMRDEFISKTTLSTLKKLVNKYPEKLDQFIRNNDGLIFQNFVMQILLQKAKKGVSFGIAINYSDKNSQNVNYQLILKSSKHTFSLQQLQNKKPEKPEKTQKPEQKFQHQYWSDEGQVQKDSKQNEEKLSFLQDVFKPGSYFFTVAKGEPRFDFVLSSRKGRTLSLTFVDITISGSKLNYIGKVNKFASDVKKIVRHFLGFKPQNAKEGDQLEKLQIYYVVLAGQSLEKETSQQSNISSPQKPSLLIQEAFNQLEPEERERVEFETIHAKFNQSFKIEGADQDCRDIIQKIKFILEYRIKSKVYDSGSSILSPADLGK